MSGVRAPEATSTRDSFSGLLAARAARELITSVLPSELQAASRGWKGPVAVVSGSSRPQAPGRSRAASGSSTRQAPPAAAASRIPLRSSTRPAPFLRLKATVVPSGENAGLSSMTSQAPGQWAALRSRCRSSRSTGTVHTCLLPPPPLITWLRVNARVVPSEDQVGWASPPWSCPSGGTITPRSAPVAASAIRIRPGPEAPPTPPGEVRVKARYRPSGENVGSVSQSLGPRPASGSAVGPEPSASAIQIRSIRPAGRSGPAGASSNRVSTIRRPSGV